METAEMDVKQVREQMVATLADWGFTPRDSDGTDFARPERPDGLRFKVGTSYHEVALTVWVGPDQRGAIRINRPHQVGGTVEQVIEWIDRELEGAL